MQETDIIESVNRFTDTIRKTTDVFTVFAHTATGTNPRVCDMHTDWGREQAWELFWENGKRGLL